MAGQGGLEDIVAVAEEVGGEEVEPGRDVGVAVEEDDGAANADAGVVQAVGGGRTGDEARVSGDGAKVSGQGLFGAGDLVGSGCEARGREDGEDEVAEREGAKCEGEGQRCGLDHFEDVVRGLGMGGSMPTRCYPANF